MSVITQIISIVLKSVADNKISNELAKELMGVSIDEASEAGIKKINDFINEEKTKIDSILSRDNMRTMNIQEENIDYVVTEIKDLFSKIDVEDEVLRQCKYDCIKLKDYFWNEYGVRKSDYIECESDIKKGLYAVSEAILKLVRESEEFESDVLIHISNSVDDIRLEEQTNFENIMKRFDKVDESNNALFSKVSDNSNVNKNIKLQKKVKRRTQEYLDKWNENMFLNNFNKRDENAGVNVKLSEVYLEEHLPHYIWGENRTERSDLKDLLSEYIYEHNENKMLLILGQPGIGKSTLITWITANFVNEIDRILVYKFASDLKNVNWGKAQIDIVDEMINELNLTYDELYGKILILDGFDEINTGNSEIAILKQLYQRLIKNTSWYKVSIIITCRVNYIQEVQKIGCDYITLQSWDEIQIKSFCTVFQKRTNNGILESTVTNVVKNKDILGIPLILYMVLALNLAIEKEGSIVDIYDKIFSLGGGIYDRCINNRSFEDAHRIGEIKIQIHQISREIAIWMFENEPVKACISQNEYKKICNKIMKNYTSIIQDSKIGNYFKAVKHCEGLETEELYFVHRTIYEYFVAETIYSSIESDIIELTEESQKKFIGKISMYLKQGRITNKIGEYLQFKLLKLYYYLDYRKRPYFYQWWERAVEKMMDKGMFYFSGKNIRCFENIIDKEIQCFLNLMKILRLILKTSTREYMLENADKEQLEKYIRLRLVACRMEERYGAEILDLSNVFLVGINLSGADLKMVNLFRANLSRANLSGTDLSRKDLREVNLKGANLEGTNLEGANIENTIWNKEDLQKVIPQLIGAKFTYIIVKDEEEQKQRHRDEIFIDKDAF